MPGVRRQTRGIQYSDSGSSNGSADKAAAKKTEPAKSSSASEKVA